MGDVKENYKLLLSIIRQKMIGEGTIVGVDWKKVADDLGLQTADGARRRWRTFRQHNSILERKAATTRPRRARKQAARKLVKLGGNEQRMKALDLSREAESDTIPDESKGDGKSGDATREEAHKLQDNEIEWCEFEEDEA